jgi:glycosyltransferase involved in cell wall biosynthesis
MKFSIGIPAYKSRFLKECIDSILAQAYTDFELIIVNDASPENLDDIVNCFSDNRIRYYVNERNTGAEYVVENWNRCLAYAQGEFFVLMGDDDRMAPNFLEEFEKLINKYPSLNVYHCRSLIINENSEPITLSQSLPEYESVYDNVWHRMNEWRKQYVSDFVYRTSILKGNGGFFKTKLAWASDDITSFIAMSGKGIAHINLPLFLYRRSSFTISSSGSVELKLEAIKMEEIWYKDFVKNNAPDNELDHILKKSVEKGLPRYIKKKTIETVAYHGYNNKIGFLRNFLYWYSRRKKHRLTLKELVFALILALKKQHAQSLV